MMNDFREFDPIVIYEDDNITIKAILGYYYHNNHTDISTDINIIKERIELSNIGIHININSRNIDEDNILNSLLLNNLNFDIDPSCYERYYDLLENHSIIKRHIELYAQEILSMENFDE